MSGDDDHRRQWQATRLWYASRRLNELASQVELVQADLADGLVDVGPEDEITSFIPECVHRLRECADKIARYAEDRRP